MDEKKPPPLKLSSSTQNSMSWIYGTVSGAAKLPPPPVRFLQTLLNLSNEVCILALAEFQILHLLFCWYTKNITGRVSFHLSSTNSRDLGNSKHEINLSPGLEIDGAADPVCHLHDLSFCNNVANCDDVLYYKNGTVNLGLGQLDGGNVQLHVPSAETTKLYVRVHERIVWRCTVMRRRR